MCIYGNSLMQLSKRLWVESKHKHMERREKKKWSDGKKARDNWAVNLCSLYDSTWLQKQSRLYHRKTAGTLRQSTESKRGTTNVIHFALLAFFSTVELLQFQHSAKCASVSWKRKKKQTNVKTNRNE